MEVTYMMVEEETGGFITGIVKRGSYTRSEIESGKHNELIKGIKLQSDCVWSFSISDEKIFCHNCELTLVEEKGYLCNQCS